VYVEQIGGREDEDLAHHVRVLTHQLLELHPLLNDRRTAGEPLTCSPMIVRSQDTSIVTIRNGPAVMSLMTATRTSSLIGLTPTG
jgi:hypothetical protein